ncbi:MAG: hypothetical protein ACFFF4_02940 [Candidatus Thorarchaeota archaeon]
MVAVNAVVRIQSVLAEVKSTVRRIVRPEVEYDEAARAHRCMVASEQAMNELEHIKSGGRSDLHRTSFIR